MIMNTLTLYMDQIINGREVMKDGLHFTNVALIKMLIDGDDIDELEYFKDSLIYFDELEISKSCSGNYLIFTCACGVAEDGGWEGVRVNLDDTVVSWVIDVGAEILHYTFDREQYDSEIESVKAMLELNKFPLEPKAVVFPDSFHR